MIVGYARVSTTDQNLDVQIEQLTGSGCERIFDEKQSATAIQRPQLAACLDFVRSGDTLTVCKLDRLARSTKHLLEIVEGLEVKGVVFQVLNINLDTSTPTGKLMLTMLGAVAAFERELIRERQAEGIAKAKAKGKFKGRKPTARAKAPEIFALIETRPKIRKKEIAYQFKIGLTTVYRLLKERAEGKL